MNLHCSLGSSGEVITLGKVKPNLIERATSAVMVNALNSLFINSSGSYFLPSPVDGRLTQIMIFGALSAENLEKLFNAVPLHVLPGQTALNFYPHVYAVVYRFNANESTYSRHYGPTLITHGLTPNALNIAEDVYVKKGDLVGVLIPKGCMDRGDDIPLCPSQVNLEVQEGRCSYAFFHSMDNVDTIMENIPTMDFQEVFVDLSMEATISLSKFDTIVALEMVTRFTRLG